ncbi:hypothetical protein YN1_7570 [Nanoarchaeota archaeon]
MDKKIYLDLDGTLLSKYLDILNIFKKYLGDEGYKKFVELVEFNRKLGKKEISFIDILKQIINNEEIIKKIYKEMNKKILNQNLVNIIRKMKNRGWKIVIVTKNEEVDKLLEMYNIKDIADEIVITRKPAFINADIYIGNEEYEDMLSGKLMNAFTIKISELSDISINFDDNIEDIFVNNEVYNFLSKYYNNKLNILLDLFNEIGINKDSKILDLNKYYVKYLREKGYNVYEDINDEKFDLIYINSFDKDISELLNELKNILNKNGWLIINIDKELKNEERKIIDNPNIFVYIHIMPKEKYIIYKYEIYEKNTCKKYLGIVRKINYNIEDWKNILKIFKNVIIKEIDDEYWIIVQNN